MRKFAWLMIVACAMLIGLANSAQAQNSNPTILVTEVCSDPTNGSGAEYMELTNVSSSPIDIAGYTVSIVDGTNQITKTSLTGKVLQPLEVYVISDGATPPSNAIMADEGIGTNILWNPGGSGGVLVLDDNGALCDFMIWGTAVQSSWTNPALPANSWIGANVTGTVVFNNSFKRTGQADTDTNADWAQTTGNSLNTINTGLDIKSGSTWTGTNSSDWTDAGNWDGGNIPDAQAGAIIPNGATTANDPVLPAMATINGLKLEMGAILDVGNIGAILQVAGDFVNEGATIVPGDGVIELNGTSDQAMTTTASNMGNVSITNTAGIVTVDDEWTAANSGLITMATGTTLRFEATALNFSGNTFNNVGTIELGLTDMGLTATLQSITAGGVNIGNTKINVADAMDTVTFVDAVGFGDFTIEGMGTVNVLGGSEINGTTNAGMFGGTFTQMGDVTGSGDIVLDQTGAFVFPGNVTCNSLTYTGGGDLTITGALTATSNVTLQPIGPTAVFSAASIDAGGALLVNFGGSMAAMIGGDVAAGSFHILDGDFTATGGLTTASTEFDTADSATFGMNSDAGDATLAGSGTLTFGSVNFGTLSTADGIVLIGGGDASITGNVNANSTTAAVFAGDVTFNGTGPQNVSFADGMEAERLIVTNVVGINLAGEYWLKSNSGFNPAFSVAMGAGVVVENSTLIELGDGAAGGLMQVSGALVTTAGNTDLLRPVIGAHASAGHARVVLTTSAVINVSGAVFRNVGNPAFAFGVDIQANSNMLAFNHVEFTDSQALTAALGLSTQTVPGTLQNLRISGQAGGSNIDASAIMGIHINVTEPAIGGGNLYGVGAEIDPNGVLFWDNPPVIDITAPTSDNLPGALVDSPYTFQVTAVGGNQPMNWSLANAPDWLSINPTTGELGGTPDNGDIGSRSFVIIAADSSTPQEVGNKIVTIQVGALTQVDLIIITESLLDGKIGEQYGFTLAAGGGVGPYSWSADNIAEVPPGLSIAQTGQILGSPTAEGVYSFGIRVRDTQNGTAVKIFSLTVRNDFNDPGTINSALTGGGGGGGCAIDASNTSTILLALLALVAFVAVRRRKAAKA